MNVLVIILQLTLFVSNYIFKFTLKVIKKVIIRSIIGKDIKIFTKIPFKDNNLSGETSFKGNIERKYKKQ